MHTAEQQQLVEAMARAMGIDVDKERAAFEKFCAVKSRGNWSVWLGRSVAGASGEV